MAHTKSAKHSVVIDAIQVMRRKFENWSQKCQIYTPREKRIGYMAMISTTGQLSPPVGGFFPM